MTDASARLSQRALEIAQRLDDELLSAPPAGSAGADALTTLLEGAADTLLGLVEALAAEQRVTQAAGEAAVTNFERAGIPEGAPDEKRVSHQDADPQGTERSTAPLPEAAFTRDWEADYWKAEAQLLKVIHWGERTFGYKNNTEIRPGDDWADVLIREAEASLSPSQGAPPPQGSAPGCSKCGRWVWLYRDTGLCENCAGLRPQGSAPYLAETRTRVLRAIEASFEEISALNKGKKWQMRVPVDSTDSDETISRGLLAARDFIQDAAEYAGRVGPQGEAPHE